MVPRANHLPPQFLDPYGFPGYGSDMNTQPEVVNIIAEHLSHYPHVEKVILFGSRARGDERERSDIDIAVFGEDITDSEWTDMWTYVDDEARFSAIGVVEGLDLYVVYTMRGEVYRIISARRAGRHEREQYSETFGE